MKFPNPIHNTQYSLSTKICLFLLPFVIGVFVYALGDLFYQSRRILRQEAVERANCELETTVLRVEGFMKEVETISRNTKWQVLDNLEPDSLLAFSYRAVSLNPNVNSCSITMEPDFFPSYGHFFSAHTVCCHDTIKSGQEAESDYYEKVWYKYVYETGKAEWIDPYNDFCDGDLSSPEIITSYCDPIYTNEGRFIGVISTALSLQRLSKVISLNKPYENSYCLMLGQDGKFIIHPDSAQLVNQTIFDQVDPLTQPDVIALGHQMMAQKKGYMKVKLNGKDCFVFYQPMAQTNWSIALVCPESDIFHRYNQLVYILFPLLGAGLIFMFFFCRKIVAFFIKPLGTLERQTRYIADGHFDKPLEPSRRSDVVGRLQNSFVTMQDSLSQYVHHLERVNSETARHNAELQQANLKAHEAAKRQTAFLQDVLHQIRTPLNIIMGFVQVLRDDYTMISRDEVGEVTETMHHNANTITRIVDMLMASSAIDGRKTIEHNDSVRCADVIREVESVFNARTPHIADLRVESLVGDELQIRTNKDYLLKILNELLYNAKKFTTKGDVTLRVKTSSRFLQFFIEDKGPGIPQSYRQQIFTQFSKFNTFSEGLGLGLSISKQFSVLLGGNLWLDTEYTEGARFVLEVPLDC